MASFGGLRLLAGMSDEAKRQRFQLLHDLANSRFDWSFRGNIRRKTPKGRIIRSYVKDGVLHELHATKGWRTRRLEAR